MSSIVKKEVMPEGLGCACCASDNKKGCSEEKLINRSKLYATAASAVLLIIALVSGFSFWVKFALYVIAYLLVGGEILLKAGKNLIKGRIFDENFLMSIATSGAFASGEFPEGVAVMLFYQVGMFFEDMAVSRSRKSIAALMDIRPDYANLRTGGGEKRVDPGEVCVGDIILVKPGERVPLDGKVVEGWSMLDTSALTGESLPRVVDLGSDVLSGSVNKNGMLAIEVSRNYEESTVTRILDLVQNAAEKKAPTENFITKFARYYTPAVVAVAVLLAVFPPLIIPEAAFRDWVYKALVFLVVSCPCALVISIPLSFFGGIGGASKNGILVKGSNYMEALCRVDTVVFDKTGTLTEGVFEVTKIHHAHNAAGFELLENAAHAESYSSHPIALSIMRAYDKEIDKSAVTEVMEIPGYGIQAAVNGKQILAGNAKLMTCEGVLFTEAEEIGTIVYIAADKAYKGYIVIADRLKDDSASAVDSLRKLGVRRLVMLTGDSKAVGGEIGRAIGLDEVYTDMLPDQKVAELERLDASKPRGGKLVYVGDGINDAPVLARADVGVAMGGIGSDAAIEAADVVLMTDEPSKLVTAVKIAKRTRKIVWQNILFAMAVKVLVLALGAAGVATIWEAVFADVGVTVIATFNAIRVLNTNRLQEQII
ncbi:MAG: cadmium-translocating P-type ATPase [Clostridiales bacterium]|nr:cadmium-translocating P-type ATPase [Clostridiales bacterium]